MRRRGGGGSLSGPSPRCGWCLSPTVAGRCTCCGRPAGERTSTLAEPLAARLAARRRELAAGGRARGPGRRQVIVRPGGSPVRRLRWVVLAALAGAALLYAAIPFVEPLLPLSWRTGCDICGLYVTDRGTACERFFIGGDRPDHARYVNSCAARPPQPAEHLYRVHRREDGSFWLAPAALSSDYRPVTFSKVAGDGELWRSDSPAMFADSRAGLFRRAAADGP